MPQLEFKRLEPVSSIVALLEHLTTQVVHETYVPFLRLPVLHAVRVTVAWASLTRGRRGRERGVGVLQDMFGYLVLAWGGSTLAALLQSTPPAWLISPTVWIIYPLTYLLLIPTGASSLLARVPGVDLVGAYVDGLTRGSTIAAITAASVSTSTMGRAVLGAIATGGGGWIVHSFGMHRTEWTLGLPPPLEPGAGLLATLDVWAAVLCSLVYSAITTATDTSSGTGTSSLISTWTTHLSAEGWSSEPQSARAVCVLIMASLLAARVVTKWILPARTGASMPSAAARDVPAHDTSADIAESGNGSEASTPRKRKSTPRKSPGPKSR